ncbi:MAG: uroporphyrinogen-III synthase [Chloroflexota bacterium]
MKVLITRPRAQADDFAGKLRSAGFELVFFPVIEIRPVENNTALDEALKNLDRYAWAVFTSVNAVEAVFSPSPLTPLPRGEGDSLHERSPSPFGRGQGEGIPPSHFGRGNGGEGLRIAAIGPKTAAALRKNGIEPDFIPDEFIGEAILSGLGDVKDKWILLPRAEIARKELPEAIAKAGGIVHEIVVYKTLPALPDPDGIAALKSGVDVITFTSASTVKNFVAIAQKNHLDPLHLPNNPLFACIGPITAQAAQEAGFENTVVAKEYTTDGLIEALTKMETP